MCLHDRSICGQVLGQIRNGVTGDGDAVRAPGRARGSCGVDRGGVIDKVGGKAALLNVVLRQVPGKLVNDGSHHFQMAQFLGAWIVGDMAHQLQLIVNTDILDGN